MNSVPDFLFTLRPIFYLCQQFLMGDSLSVMGFRQKIIAEIKQFNCPASLKYFNQQALEHAFYAIVAFVDELVLYSSRQDIAEWQKEPLQAVFFSDNLAGEIFFEHLTIYQKNPSEHQSILTLYYICLSLGFSGRYRFHGAENLQALKQWLARHLAFEQQDYCLSVLGAQGDKRPLIRPRNFFKSLLIVSGSLIACIYVFYFLSINHQTTVVTSIFDEAQNILMRSSTGGL